MATNVEAHITGTVWKIVKQVGDQVGENEEIMILESMKMEMPVESPTSGTLKELKVAEGDSVMEGDVVAVLE